MPDELAARASSEQISEIIADFLLRDEEEQKREADRKLREQDGASAPHGRGSKAFGG